MYTVRCIAERGGSDVPSFELEGAPAIGVGFHRLLKGGATRPEWCHVLQRHGVDIGRVGFRVQPTCPPEFLGCLPARELFPFGLWLRWDEPDAHEAGCYLLSRAREAIRQDVSEPLQAAVYRRDGHCEQRHRLFSELGMDLFQEKQGYGWNRADAPPTEQHRLRFLELASVGEARYRDVLARAGADTLDRNVRWYRQLAGELNWASVFMTLHEPSEPGAWLLALDRDANEVGVVAVSRFERETATITFIGVVPEQRGNGYVDDLLRGASAAALAAGFDAMLSDADVHNSPMTSAFLRNGHRADVRDWHKWHFRERVGAR